MPYLIQKQADGSTVIGKLQDEPKGYRTYIREISKDAKP